MIYQKPKAEIVIFENNDIIVTSGSCTLSISHSEGIQCPKKSWFYNCGLIFHEKAQTNHNNSPSPGPGEDPFANM